MSAYEELMRNDYDVFFFSELSDGSFYDDTDDANAYARLKMAMRTIDATGEYRPNAVIVERNGNIIGVWGDIESAARHFVGYQSEE